MQLKYCTVKPQISISLISESNHIVLEIGDNGIGIAKDQQALIFGKYFRVPTGNIHDNNGFGLGLYHVKNIITRMGGTIKVRSTLGKGSVFSVEFPCSAGI